MFSLLLKDWRSAKLFLALLVPWCVLFNTQFYLGGGFNELYLLLAFSLMLLPLILDRFHDTESTICCLPVSRAQVVTARYLSGLIGCCLSLLLRAGHGYALQAWLFDGEGAPAAALTHSEAGTFLLLFIFVELLFLPLYFAFGLPSALLATSLILAGILVSVVCLVPGPATQLLGHREPIATLGTRIAAAAGTAGFFWVLGLVLFIFLAAAASLWVSIRAFRARDI